MTAHRNPPELVNQLVNDNFKLARFWAHRFAEVFGYNEALSVAMAGLLGAAEKYDEALGIPFGTYASVRIKWRAGCERRKLMARCRGGDYLHLSFDKEIFHDSTRTLGDEIACDRPTPCEIMGENESKRDVRAMLADLPPRTRNILELRYGLTGKPPMLLAPIAQKHGLTVERVRQIEAAALRKFWRDKRRKKLEPVDLARVA